jgi:hypothetical protein
MQIFENNDYFIGKLSSRIYDNISPEIDVQVEEIFRDMLNSQTGDTAIRQFLKSADGFDTIAEILQLLKLDTMQVQLRQFVMEFTRNQVDQRLSSDDVVTTPDLNRVATIADKALENSRQACLKAADASAIIDTLDVEDLHRTIRELQIELNTQQSANRGLERELRVITDRLAAIERSSGSSSLSSATPIASSVTAASLPQVHNTSAYRFEQRNKDSFKRLYRDIEVLSSVRPSNRNDVYRWIKLMTRANVAVDNIAPDYTTLISHEQIPVIVNLLMEANFVHPYKTDNSWQSTLVDVPFNAIKDVLTVRIAPKTAQDFFKLLQETVSFVFYKNGNNSSEMATLKYDVFLSLVLFFKDLERFCQHALINIQDSLARLGPVAFPLPALFATGKGADSVTFFSVLCEIAEKTSLQIILDTLTKGHPNLPAGNPFVSGETHTIADAAVFCTWCVHVIQRVILAGMDSAESQTAYLSLVDTTAVTKLFMKSKPTRSDLSAVTDNSHTDCLDHVHQDSDLHLATSQYKSGSNALQFAHPSRHPGQQTPFQIAHSERPHPPDRQKIVSIDAPRSDHAYRPPTALAPTHRRFQEAQRPRAREDREAMERPRQMPLSAFKICFEYAKTGHCSRHNCRYRHDDAPLSDRDQKAYDKLKSARMHQYYNMMKPLVPSASLLSLNPEDPETDETLDNFVEQFQLQDTLMVPLE